MKHIIFRIDHATFRDTILPAFKVARDEVSLTPLEPYIAETILDPGKHILTGKRFLIFGAEHRALIGVGRLARAAIEGVGRGSIRAHAYLEPLVAEARAASADPIAVGRWRAAMDGDVGLPDWMKGDEGPAVYGPKDAATLIEQFRTLVGSAEVASRDVHDVLEFLEAHDATDGLAVLRR